MKTRDFFVLWIFLNPLGLLSNPITGDTLLSLVLPLYPPPTTASDLPLKGSAPVPASSYLGDATTTHHNLVKEQVTSFTPLTNWKSRILKFELDS